MYVFIEDVHYSNIQILWAVIRNQVELVIVELIKKLIGVVCN